MIEPPESGCPTIHGRERMPQLLGLHILCANGNDERENGRDLEDDHDVVGFSRLADATEPRITVKIMTVHKKRRKIETKVDGPAC